MPWKDDRFNSCSQGSRFPLNSSLNKKRSHRYMMIAGQDSDVAIFNELNDRIIRVLPLSGTVVRYPR